MHLQVGIRLPKHEEVPGKSNVRGRTGSSYFQHGEGDKGREEGM